MLRLTIISLLSLLLSGCVSAEKEPAQASSLFKGSAAIDELNLLAIPVALNLDAEPGPDGFVVKIYPGNRRSAKSVAISGGVIDVFMFDGAVSAGRELPPPRRTWRYTADDLKRYQIDTSIGTGYQIAPYWQEAKPTGDKITVIMRYTSPERRTVYSAPSVISVTGQ